MEVITAFVEEFLAWLQDFHLQAFLEGIRDIFINLL